MYSQPLSQLSMPNSSNANSRIQVGTFIQRFNELFRTRHMFPPEALFDHTVSLMMEFMKYLSSLQKRKYNFESVIYGNLALGAHSKNKKIVLFHVKLIELYLRFQLNLKKVFLSEELLTDYTLLERQFHEKFNIKIALISTLKDGKLKSIVERGIAFLFRFIHIEQTDKHMKALNIYFNQALQIQNFTIYYEILSNYFQTLKDRPFKFPFIEVNTVLKAFFDFPQLSSNQYQTECAAIIRKYVDLFQIPNYIPHLGKNFESVFRKIAEIADKNPKQIDPSITLLYNLIFDYFDQGIIFSLPQFKIEPERVTSTNQKLFFFFSFYREILKNPKTKTFEDFDLDQINFYSKYVRKNIHNLIHSDHNFVRLVDIIVNKIESLKVLFLDKITSYEKLIAYKKSKKEKPIQVLTQLMQIQTQIISNRNYLANDNFRNTAYFAKTGLLQIKFELLEIQTHTSSTKIEKVINKWIEKISILNLEQQVIRIFYSKILMLLAKMLSSSKESSQISLALRCIETIIEKIPDFLNSHFNVLNIWNFILEKLIGYYQEKKSKNQVGNEYFNQIKGIDYFAKNFAEFTLKNSLNYFKKTSQKQQENYDMQTQNLQMQIINNSLIAFSLNNQSVTKKDLQKFVALISNSLQALPQDGFQQNLQNQIIQNFEDYILTMVQNVKNSEQAKSFFQIEFILDLYRKIVKIGAKKKKISSSKDHLKALKRVNFIMNLKQIVTVENKNTLLQQFVQKTELCILGCPCREYIQSRVDKNNYFDQSNEAKLEIMLDILIKNVYFITHQYSNADCCFNTTGGKNNSFTSEEVRPPDQSSKKTRRQIRQSQAKSFDNYLLTFQNSSIAIGKAKSLLLKMIPKFTQIMDQFPVTWINNIKVIDFSAKNIQKFDNPLSMLGYTWNLLWMLKIADMKDSIMQFLKLRLGLLHYFSNELNNPNILQFEIDKIRFFGLISIQYNPKQLSPSKMVDKAFQHKLLLNQIGEADIGSVKSRIQTIIFLFNNLPCSKNFKILISYISSIIIDFGKQSEISLNQVKTKSYPFFNQSFNYKKKSLLNQPEKILKYFFEIRSDQVGYPLMTLIFRKLMFFVKKHNQISEMRSLIATVTSYFSKTGLGIYFDEVVEIWLMRNVKINALKIVDCYQILQNNALRCGDLEQNQQKMKVFQKINKMLCNKRRSVSVYFTFKGFVDLIEQLKKSQISMNYNISRIILYQFKEQFNLYKYEVDTIISHAYGNERHSEFYEYSSAELDRLQKIEEICRKIVFEVNFFKAQSLQGFNYAIASLKFLHFNLPEILLTNFQTGQTAQSLIGYMIEYLYEFTPQKLKPVHGLIDQVILNLAVSMIDLNYEFKSFVYECQSIENIYKDQPITIFNKICFNNNLFSKFSSEFPAQISQKIRFLKSSGKSKLHLNPLNSLAFPLSIIYPLRNNVYNIAIFGQMLITKVDRFYFDQNLSTIEQFIDNDSDILMKQKSVKDWWKARIRLDRQMGKIAQSTDLGIFDSQSQGNLNIKNVDTKKIQKFLPFFQDQITIHLDEFLQKSQIEEDKKDQIRKALQIQSQLRIIGGTKNHGEHIIKQNILIMTINRLSIYPFEKLKLLSKYNGIYRVPSVRYIMEQQKIRENKSIIYNIRNLSYVINPSNDLVSTQKTFLVIKAQVLKKAKTELQWQGIMNVKPTHSQFQFLFKKEVYVYMGHGSGMSHIREKQFYQIPVNTVAMLFGCSSLNMDHRCSQFYGIPLIMLKNHCPALLGANWEVTDKDTDFLTSKIFESIEDKKTIDLSFCLQQAKKHMKLSNLNGGAIVVYGLPVQLILD